MLGTVAHFDRDRGFGFIRPDDGEADIFVHVTGIESSVDYLATGDRVTFKTEIDPKRGKPRARAVTLVEA